MAGRTNSWLSCFKRRPGGEISTNMLKNGGALLQKLIAMFGARYNNPIRFFTVEQLTKATNHFADSIYKDRCGGSVYRGCQDGHSILVTMYLNLEEATTDIAVSSQLSHLKNVLKFIGCCLEFEYPALVSEAAGAQIVSDFFPSHNNDVFLPWKTRVKIAKDIATTLTYLHTAFSTPVIHRDVKLRNVIIDQFGHAKLFSFSVSISLPPGREEVVDRVYGSFMYVDPEYVSSAQVTPKVDVYGFGILLLELLTGRQVYDLRFSALHRELGQVKRFVHCKLHCKPLDQIVDSNIWQAEEEAQYRAFLDLVLRCTKTKEDRPDMIDVAKELCRIEKNEIISSSS